ncbi:MAG: pentapeptide repeat-containing protein [Alphaproteobacteria bacterium]|nr:pentapeptide repeat-containing protein [Alphaproteobacteria bacterium]OJV15284.1 MAG: hypothetical protein BGO27_02110 [Alphaproteobacteria bacterium 33-17]
MNSAERQDFINNLAAKTLEERKKTILTREQLNMLEELYAEGDPVINVLIADGSKLDLSYFDMSEQDLRGFNFANFILKNCNFRKSRFDGESLKTILSKANSDKISLKGLDLRQADLSSQVIYERAIGVTLDIPYNFEGQILDKSNFAGADLTNANFDKASLKGVILKNSNLIGASFNGSDIQGANFDGAFFEADQLAQSLNFEEAIFSDNSIIADIKKALHEIENPQNPTIKKLKKLFSSIKLSLKAKAASAAFTMRKAKMKDKDIEEEFNPEITMQNIESPGRFADKVSKDKEKSAEQSFRK